GTLLGSGTISVTGNVGANSGSLLTGTVTDFGFLSDGPIFFQFAFADVGGALAGDFGALGGVTLNAGSEDFDGSYQHAFTGEGVADVATIAVPTPAGFPAGVALFACI